LIKSLVSIEEIENLIYLIRGLKVMLAFDLAELYGTETRVLNQAVTRHKDNFPEDFMFQLSWEETKNLRSQIVTLDSNSHFRYRPRAFTEHGILMLSSVLNSKKAVQINIEIMRAFVKQRKLLIDSKQSDFRLEVIEKRLADHDEAFELFNKVILPLLEKTVKPKRKIGFKPQKKK